MTIILNSHKYIKIDRNTSDSLQLIYMITYKIKNIGTRTETILNVSIMINLNLLSCSITPAK